MKEAEKKHLHGMFDQLHEDLNSARQELACRPFDDSWVVVTPEDLDLVGFCFKLSRQAVLIGLLHLLGDLSFKNLKGCMRDIFNLLGGLYQSLSNAGPTLSNSFRRPMREIGVGVLRLLRCAIGYAPYWSSSDANRILGLALKVLDLYDAIRKLPQTNFRAIGLALVHVASGIKEAISEMERKAARAQQRTIAELVIGTASGAYQMITELIRAVTEWEKTSVHVVIRDLEGLLEMSAGTSYLIDEIKERLFPLREVDEILMSLSLMGALIGHVEQEVRRYGYRSARRVS